MPRLETGGPTSTHSVERALSDHDKLLSNSCLESICQTCPTDTARTGGLRKCLDHRAVEPCTSLACRCSCMMHLHPPQNRPRLPCPGTMDKSAEGSGGEQPPESSHPLPGCGFQIKTPFPGYVLRTTRGYRLQRLRRTQLPAPKGRGDTGLGDPGFRSAPPRAVAVSRVAARAGAGCLSGKGAPRGTTTDFRCRSSAMFWKLATGDW